MLAEAWAAFHFKTAEVLNRFPTRSPAAVDANRASVSGSVLMPVPCVRTTGTDFNPR